MNFGEYLDYENCKCRKKLFDKLVEECTEYIDEVKMANPLYLIISEADGYVKEWT